MIPQDIGPLAVRILSTNKHSFFAGPTVAENTGQSGVIGVSVADEPCHVVSEKGYEENGGDWKNGPMQFGWSK